MLEVSLQLEFRRFEAGKSDILEKFSNEWRELTAG